MVLTENLRYKLFHFRNGNNYQKFIPFLYHLVAFACMLWRPHCFKTPIKPSIIGYNSISFNFHTVGVAGSKPAIRTNVYNCFLILEHSPKTWFIPLFIPLTSASPFKFRPNLKLVSIIKQVFENASANVMNRLALPIA